MVEIIIENVGDKDTKFIWRSGNPATNDFEKTDLTDDTNWNDLDLSSIIPTNAIAVLIKVLVLDATANQYVHLRQNGQTQDKLTALTKNQVANIIVSLSHIVAVDSDRKLEIKCSVKPTDWTQISLMVLGWWI
jgi:hypothetical protein